MLRLSLVALLTASACGPHKPPESQVDEQAVTCVVVAVLSEASSVLSVVLPQEPLVLIPASEFDVSKCGLVVAPASVPPIEPAVALAALALRAQVADAKNCKTRVGLTAAADWVSGAIGPILDEVRNPDGRVLLPELKIEPCLGAE